METEGHLTQLLLTVVYAVLGVGVFGLAYVTFDKLMPFSVHKEIEEDQNTALGVVLGSVVLGLSIIIAAAMT